jgi:DNA-directed RNA polymerase subunit K/omega
MGYGMTFGSPDMGKFVFVQLAALRAAQLMRGCTPRVAHGLKATTTALREVAENKVCGVEPTEGSGPGRPAR